MERAATYAVGTPVVRHQPPRLRVVDAPSFSALPHAVLFDKRLSRDARLLYAVLQSYWRQGGECWATHATLADDLGVKERMLRYYLRELIAHGYITERRHGRGQQKAYAASEAATTAPPSGNRLPVEPATDCQLDAQAARDCQPKRQPVANRRINSEEEDIPGVPVPVVGVAAIADDHPTPKVKVPREKSRRTKAPDTFSLSMSHYEFAGRFGFDQARADGETEKFLDHHRSKGTLGQDWAAGWRNWIRKAAEFDAQRRQPAISHSSSRNGTDPHRRPPSEEARRSLADKGWEI